MKGIIECRIKIRDRESQELSENLGVDIPDEGTDTIAYIQVANISMFYENTDRHTSEPCLTIDFVNGDGVTVYEPIEDFLQKWQYAL